MERSILPSGVPTSSTRIGLDSRLARMSANPLDDPATDPHEVARTAAAELAARTGIERHDIALTLGSGWGQAAELLGTTVAEVPAHELTGFDGSHVVGHAGTLRSVRLEDGRHVLVNTARTHLYEGRGVRRVAHSVRVAAAAGARAIVLTNGAGGLDPAWAPGTVALITDHLNLTATSPLEGATFVDLTDLYSPRLRDIARAVDAELTEGVYVQFRGPHYETPAEVRMAGVLGGHIVGMSTTIEAIAAREAGLEVLGLSLITNLAAGISQTPLSHGEVIAAGEAAKPRIGRLLADIARRI